MNNLIKHAALSVIILAGCVAPAYDPADLGLPAPDAATPAHCDGGPCCGSDGLPEPAGTVCDVTLEVTACAGERDACGYTQSEQWRARQWECDGVAPSCTRIGETIVAQTQCPAGQRCSPDTRGCSVLECEL